MYRYLFLTACNIYNVIKKITDPHPLQNRLNLIYFLSVWHKNSKLSIIKMHNVLRTPPQKKKTHIKNKYLLIFENGIKLLIFHVAIKFIRNSLKDKVLVQWYQICAMYTICFWCALTGTLTCVRKHLHHWEKHFLTVMYHWFMSTVWFANPNYCILIYVYIFVLYTLFNIIYLIKSWKEKNSLLYMNLIC